MIWKRILVPFDFSDCSLRALRLALQLGTDPETVLLLAHVAELPENAAGSDIVAVPRSALGEGGRETTAAYLRSTAQKYLEAVVRELGWQGPTEIQVLAGEVDDAILRAAQDLRADVIVMGTHGRTGIAHFFQGSVTESVVRRADTPIVSVRVPNATESGEGARFRARLEDELSG